ncbi:MAG: hypothetical protein IPJ40_18995 [Saprospirales bacterium]|nr:hypothetical protein [Saprospirales bacterium]
MGIFRLSIAVSFLLLTGCQTKEAASGPKIFGSLYVRYLQDGGLLKAEASFFKGDSAQHAKPITILGGVSFQSSGMEHRNIQDKLIRYQYETTAVYPDEFTFQVQDDQGKSHQFQLQMPPVSQFILADTIYLDREMTLELLPAPQSPRRRSCFSFHRSDREGLPARNTTPYFSHIDPDARSVKPASARHLPTLFGEETEKFRQ